MALNTQAPNALAAERHAAIRACQRDGLLTALGKLQTMRDTLAYREFADDERNVDAAVVNAARVGEYVLKESPLVSEAGRPFHDPRTKMDDDPFFEFAPRDLWNLLGEAESLLEEVRWRPLVIGRAARDSDKNERNPIASPNRHARLPCPAKGAVVALLHDLSGELALLGVTGIALFGSVARGEDAPDSDIDIAVAIAGADNLMLRIRIGKLVEVHTGRHVDVVYLPLRHPLDKTAAGDLVMV